MKNKIKYDWESEFYHQLNVNYALAQMIIKNIEKRLERACLRKCKYCKKGIVCENCCEKYGKI